jgi:hypothetical protein
LFFNQEYPVKTLSSLVLFAFILSLPTFAQSFEFYPGAKYDPGMPTLKQVVGHDIGERITMHHEMEKYLAALEKAAPNRLKRGKGSRFIIWSSATLRTSRALMKSKLQRANWPTRA